MFVDSGEPPVVETTENRRRFWRGPTNLQHLNITCNTSSQLYTWITDLTNLKSLRILQPHFRAPLRLPCLAHLSALTHLDISNGEQARINLYTCTHLSNLSLARLYHFHTLRHLDMLENTSTLQHLEIRRCFRLTHSAFSAIHSVGLSSDYWTVYKFFASQTLHNIKNFKKKSGDVNDEANFRLFILLQERAKPIPSPPRTNSNLYSPLTSIP
jgi:hypothetical protein